MVTHIKHAHTNTVTQQVQELPNSECNGVIMGYRYQLTRVFIELGNLF